MLRFKDELREQDLIFALVHQESAHSSARRFASERTAFREKRSLTENDRERVTKQVYTMPES